jgi:RNA polymerase-binding transcription factor DksA
MAAAANLSAMNALHNDHYRGTRAWLLARSAELRDRVDRVRADLRREREPLPRDLPDAAIIVENDEVLHAIEDAARVELLRIRRALQRMDAGVFALCERCGDTIEPGRLRIVPYATHCGDCEPE